jgi:aryl-alcohol dehydrogenase-like predicted oxidoreductase
MSKQFLDRREFNRRCATLSFSTIFATLSNAFTPAAAVAVPDAPRRTVKLPDSTIVSALGQGSAALAQGRHPRSAAAVALTWLIRGGNVIAIPESGSAIHAKENAVALSLTLSPAELQIIDRAHPRHK